MYQAEKLTAGPRICCPDHLEVILLACNYSQRARKIPYLLNKVVLNPFSPRRSSENNPARFRSRVMVKNAFRLWKIFSRMNKNRAVHFIFIRCKVKELSKAPHHEKNIKCFIIFAFLDEPSSLILN